MGTQHVRRNLAGPLGGFAVCFAVASASPAWAGDCAPPTPECHLANGKKLLANDPKRAAQELLASYKLDERTDTLTLYAQALTADKQYALALETWQRIILFRESEIEAAKEGMRLRKTAAAAKVKMAKAQDASETAAAEIMKLWTSVARVRVVGAEKLVVTRGGVEVDATKEIAINADGDELVFTRADGSMSRATVRLAGGQSTQIGVPAIEVAAAPKAPVRDVAKVSTGAPKTTELPKKDPVVPSPREVVEPETSVVDTKGSVALDAGPRSPTMSRIGIGLGVAGVVGLGVAATLGVIASRDFDEAQELGCDSSGQCPIGAATEMAQQSNDRARAAQLTAIGGGALLATGATLFILGRRPAKQERMTVSVNPSSITIGWSLP
ncbi:MAG: hypothetical protein ACKV2T_35950 [Kofleriaceae bacterium]